MYRRNVFYFLIITAALVSGCTQEKRCSEIVFEGQPFSVCKSHSAADLRLFHKDDQNRVLGDFKSVNAELKKTQERLVFAANAGMYHTDRSPVGLYIEDNIQTSKISTNPGPGNFHMLPNGVFWIGKGTSGVISAEEFDPVAVIYATQSGPMLVIDNELHPKFGEKSKSFRLRNGVGQTVTGEVYFVKSELPVNFHTFARLFRDELKTPNALYLDGTVSKLYSVDLGRNDTGHKMGPIVGLVESIP